MKAQVFKSFVAVLVFIQMVSCQDKANTDMAIEQIDKNYVETQLLHEKDAQLIDVRTSMEFKAGHIGNAQNIDFLQRDTFKTKIEKLDRDKPVYLYCKMGGRSHKAAILLQEMGFKKVYDYSGGYDDWSK